MADADDARIVSVTPATGRIAKDSLLNYFGQHPQAPPGHSAEDDGGSAPEQMVCQTVKEEPIDEPPQEISGDEDENREQEDAEMKPDDEVKSEADIKDEEEEDTDMKPEEDVKSESDVEDKVKAEPGVKLEAKVKDELGIKAEPGVKLEAKVKDELGIKGEPGVKLEAKVKLEKGVKVEPGVKLEKVKAEPGVKLEQVKVESGVKLENVKAEVELGVKLEQDVKSESETEDEIKTPEKREWTMENGYDKNGKRLPLALFFDEHDFFKYKGQVPPGVGPRRIRGKKKPPRFRILDDDEVGEAEIIESRSTPVAPRTEAEAEDEEETKMDSAVKASLDMQRAMLGLADVNKQAKVKTEPGIKVEPGIQLEPKVKNEPGVKVEPGIKPEPKVKTEPGIKAEPGIKIEPGSGIKREPQDDEDGESPSPKRRRIRVKSEPGVSSASSSAPAVPSPKPLAPGKLPCFRERLPGWIKDCLIFQKTKRTWAPARPCCPANCFFDEMAPPPKPAKGGKYISCFHRLTPAQQKEFRHFYEQNKENMYCSFLFAEKKDPPKLKRKPYVRPEPEPDGKVYRAFEMMKMWPWSRDLPSCAYKPGWLIKDGIAQRIDLAGEKVPFTEVWESRGKGPPDEEAEKEEQRLEAERKQTGSEAAVQEGAASSSSGQGVAKRLIKRSSKQSGEPGICWSSVNRGWELTLQQKDGKRFRKHFLVNKYIKQGYSEKEAEDAALEEAKACKKDVVRRGIVKGKDSKNKTDSLFQSEVQGLWWSRSAKNWRAQLRTTESQTRKKITIGFKSFKPKNDSRQEILKARTEAEEYLRDLRAEHGFEYEHTKVKSCSEMTRRSSGIPGIVWEPSEDCWRARVTLKADGKQKILNFRPRPKNVTQEEIDRTLQEAAAWLKETKEQKEFLTKAWAESLAASSEAKLPRKKELGDD